VLSDDVLITESCIRQRIKTKTLFIVATNPGPLAPLYAYEMEFVQVIIQMERTRESLSPSESGHLINIMIAGTQAQTNLITFKSKKSFVEDRCVGIGYWNGLKKRNGRLVCSKEGTIYKLDRSKCTTCANFA